VTAVSLPAQTIGPFYHFALTANEALGRLAGNGAKGERIHLRLRLLDGDGVPVPDGMLELWQADSNGIYRHPYDNRCETSDPAFTGFGRLATSADGVCLFETIRPGVPATAAGSEAAHINVSVFARGLLGRLITRVYFAGDTALENDPTLALVPAPRRSTLIAQTVDAQPDLWNLDIHLQGEFETVFFDL
jgi:protocatechuate 3,4-dioxygenase alpha subunit